MGWDIVAIGTNHNLPVEDPIKTTGRLIRLVDGPISVGYNESWIFKPESNSIVWSKDYKWIEIEKIGLEQKGPTMLFSINDYCARKIYLDHKKTIDKIKFVNKEERDWFMSEATDEPFALYECDSQAGPLFDLRIFKEIVEFTNNFPGRWFQFVRALNNPLAAPNKNHILEFRKHIYSQLKACGCDNAYYFADQGPGEWLYDAIDKSAKDWTDYLEKGEYIKDRTPMIIEVQKILDGSIILSEEDCIDCFIDNFYDLQNSFN